MIPFLITSVLSLAALALMIPALMFLVEVLLGARRAKRKAPPSPPLPEGASIGVLIPAHNEAGTISGILADLAEQLPLSQVLVVADNCTDDTAMVAQDQGAMVAVRNDTSRRGKGFALAHGVKIWSGHPPDVLIFLDADCRIGGDLIARLYHQVTATDRPAQAEFLMVPHSNGVSGQMISAFAMFTMNATRQRGLAALGAPAHLNGTGMAMPWTAAKSLDLATDHLVEDTMMGLHLAANGHPVIFTPAAKVRSEFPATSDGEISQRQRWEGGSGQVMVQQVPWVIRKALSGQPTLLYAAADLMIPPITRFVLMLACLLGLSIVGGIITGMLFPLLLTLVDIALVNMAIILAFITYRQQAERAVSLREILSFVALKLKVFRAGNAKGWVRTSRDNEGGGNGKP